MQKKTETPFSKAAFEADQEPLSYIDLFTSEKGSSDNQKTALEKALAYQEIRMIYSCAMKEIKTKFDVLNTEFNVIYNRNPIRSIKTRLKSTVSLLKKMEKKKIPFSLANMEEEIHDIAGIRVICSYLDDIYLLADTLIQQDDIRLICKKDYIKNPKPNGYRSLHLIVEVPVFFSKQTKRIKVEVQIRTIAMDFWASLEHQLEYKNNSHNQKEKEIKEELKHCADTIAETDLKMMKLREEIEAQGKKEKEEFLHPLEEMETSMD